IENASIETGRFINQSDVNEFKKVAVIGHKLKQDLFKDVDPIDKNISVFGMNFKVIGVFIDPGGEREESQAYIPITTAHKVFNAADYIRNMFFTAKMTDQCDDAVALSSNISKGIESQLKERHNAAPADGSAVRVYNTLEQAQRIYS